jgi:Calcineurin-like phosphoesterase
MASVHLRRGTALLAAMAGLTLLTVAAPAPAPASAATTTIAPIADSYVQADQATTNFGGATELRVDASPVTNTYLKFQVSGLSGTPNKATLKLYTRSTGSTPIRIFPVADTTWTETGITAANAPAAGSTSVGTSGALTAGSYVSIDITAAITGNGTFSLLASTGSTAVRILDSREGANPPQLAVETADPPPPGTNIYAAGDVACATDDPNYNGGAGVATACRMKATSDLMLANPADLVVALGDEQYNSGSPADFQASYDPSWGRVKALTKPVVGNHEYGQTGAGGYFGYFGNAATPLEPGCVKSCKGYYSFDAGTWHVVVLNTECTRIDGGAGCAVGSQQEQWLTADLNAHPTACTLAVGHRPRWSSNSFASADIAPLMDVLYAKGIEVYLTGHAHSYERFAPQNPAGGRDDGAGVREFVVGTGGDNSTGFGTVAANSETRKNNTFGVLRLTLAAGSYAWSYIPDPTTPFADSGQSSCH